MHNCSHRTFIAICGRILRPGGGKGDYKLGADALEEGGIRKVRRPGVKSIQARIRGCARSRVVTIRYELEFTMIHICARLARCSRQRRPLAENGRPRPMLLQIVETLVLPDGSNANTATELML